MARAPDNDNASVLVVAAHRDLAGPVLEHFADHGVAFGFMRPADLAHDNPQAFALYRLAIAIDVYDDVRVHDAATVLAMHLPCMIVSDMPVSKEHGFRAILHTDTSPAQLLDRVRRTLAEGPLAGGLVGDSAAMQKLRGLIDKVAVTSASVLIRGEAGTGKELVAREIHRRSGRRGAFVAISCGAVPQELIESELFGHEQGAFAGALKERAGHFERAAGGTVFLDEIGDMSAELQVRILRVLQAQAFERLGGGAPQRLDARIIASSRHDLAEAIAQEAFRADLFYRLAVFPITVAPLRERLTDIPALSEALGARMRAAGPRFDLMAMDHLKSHAWPGNVRELANLLERLAILYPGQRIEKDMLEGCLATVMPAPAQASSTPRSRVSPSTHIAAMALPESGVDLRQLVEALERRLIEQALERQSGVVAHAARVLGLRRTTLIEKLRRYGIGSD